MLQVIDARSDIAALVKTAGVRGVGYAWKQFMAEPDIKISAEVDEELSTASNATDKSRRQGPFTYHCP